MMNAALVALRKHPRCGAKTRRGTPCQSPAMRGKKRCRIHGGLSTGPPLGSQNNLKHGLHTREATRYRRLVRELLRECDTFLCDLEL